ncbi:Nucleoside 2-deoxyribosyltransferase [Pseudomonas grimontii]|uniref:Nucleoside 2-deoxyribosyltransferase n=1 Tax=Pseudomonas grimontii TaxID=129847 RepID=A0A1H1GZF3_9PSED|nr:nucleoside 2-deoxyribosyltransferase [Pseudomonas grimontii]TWR53725.1 hypothetical protein FIV39_31250 [Pseudomonas grimontii]SDR18206.1 Nucleoside 2-deoxyribosyltransferase [Pseudomonas grimontii]
MSDISKSSSKRCYISAPFGLELDVLPMLLAERDVFWEWAKDESYEGRDATDRIAAADFVVVILNGTSADYRGAFEAGVAAGLGKPVFLIQTKARTIPIDYSRFTIVKASLSNNEALKFHLDLFLASPPVPSVSTGTKRSKNDTSSRLAKVRQPVRPFDSLVEKRVFDAVIAAGGSAISQPQSTPGAKFRPDLLAWLGNLDPELLDPVVIEVKGDVSLENALLLNQRLWDFIQSARLELALVVTTSIPPRPEQQLSPNVLWLTIQDFERLVSSGQLGEYIRKTRNRIVHGVR